MDISEKLKILSSAAKYDVSCSSSGSNRKNNNGGLGDASTSGICHSFTPDGRCVSLLKILLSNDCVYNCKYCVNAYSKDVERATFTPEEIVTLTMNFYKRNYIEGLFLSSGIYKNPNYTMELLLETVRILRIREKFNGYIHLKAIPGADNFLIQEAGKLVDRMSVNIELPSSTSLKLLAPQKTKENILKPMSLIKNSIGEFKELKKTIKSTPLFVPGGQSTQLIIGATPENDGQILKLSENLYNNFSLKRVYYSAYVPVVKNEPTLPTLEHPPTLREHRLYQADWLLRFYGFNSKELLKEDENFDLEFDPKTSWALKNIHLFPFEINKCSYDELLRIPGIGVTSAMRIIKGRRLAPLDFIHLKRIGVVLKRAQYFMTCNGKYYGDVAFDADKIRNRLSNSDVTTINKVTTEQLSLFDSIDTSIMVPKSEVSKITGQL